MKDAKLNKADLRSSSMHNLFRLNYDVEIREPLKTIWWCCTAEYGKHDKGCPNYKEEEQP